MQSLPHTEALPLHYIQTGERGDWVVLLHGLFGSGDNLGSVARFLAADFRVVQVDLRNHGRSPHSATMTMAAMAADVALLQDRLGIDSSHVVGHSLGGKVAMQLALTDSSRVQRLVAADIAPVAYTPHHQAVFAALQSLDIANLRSRQQADQLLAPLIADSPTRLFLLKSLNKEADGFSWRFHWQALRDNYPHLLAAMSGEPFAGPTLFIKGELSDYIKPDYEPIMRELFPHFELRTIAGTGHWLHGEKPAEFNALVKGFLAGAG